MTMADIKVCDDPKWQEDGKYLFTQPCTFILSAQAVDHLPDPTLPEVAFVGRSNVGKSSIINALTRRKDLARTSHTPGRTQQLNFFNLADRIMLVDMPGYGYAKAPNDMIQQWTKLIHAYLVGRANLKRVYVLIDSRHGLKTSDHTLFQVLDEAAVSYQVILTKTDKLKTTQLQTVIKDVMDQIKLKKYVAAYPYLIATSSRTGDGVDLVKAEIAALALAAM